MGIFQCHTLRNHVLHRVLNFARVYTCQSQKGGAWFSSIHVGGLDICSVFRTCGLVLVALHAGLKIPEDVLGNWETILR